MVRVGWFSLTDDLVVKRADPVARLLVGMETRFEGLPLIDVLVPESEEDRAALAGRPPLNYLAAATGTATRLLVHLARLPNEGLFGTITSINEYLAEAQSLARVQLRNTVESIIAGFAHEVRNPMAAILSLTEVAMQQDPALDSVLVRIPGLVARVESLIKHALAYSRPKPPKRSLHQVDFLIERSASLLRPRDTAVRLDLEGDDGLLDAPPVMVDLHQAEQVLVNLLENALDAARSEVTVRVRDGGTPMASVCVAVTDDGPGVPAEVAPRIFDPFFTTKAHGTGLGLAIARDLARLNGGDLRLASVPGRTTFELFLPITPSAVRSNW